MTGNDPSVEDLFPKSWLAARTVSDAYTAGLSPELLVWRRWASTTARSGLHDFAVPATTAGWGSFLRSGGTSALESYSVRLNSSKAAPLREP